MVWNRNEPTPNFIIPNGIKLIYSFGVVHINGYEPATPLTAQQERQADRALALADLRCGMRRTPDPTVLASMT